jgi:hypothetical protein
MLLSAEYSLEVDPKVPEIIGFISSYVAERR